MSKKPLSTALNSLVQSMIAKDVSNRANINQLLNQIDELKDSAKKSNSTFTEEEAGQTLQLFSTKRVHLLSTKRVMDDDLLGSDSDDDNDQAGPFAVHKESQSPF